MPVMMPAPGASSSYMPRAASCESSRKGEPGSSNRRRRSRGSNFPRARCLERADSSPPCAARSTLARRSATSAASAREFAWNSSEPGLSLLRIAAIAVLFPSRNGMTGKQLVGMLPARFGADAPEPAMDVRVLRPAHAELVLEEQIGAGRNIGDRQPLAREIRRSPELGVEHFPRAFGPLAKFLEHRLVRARGEHAQEPVSAGVARQLVIVPEQPAQDLAPLCAVVPAIAAEALDQVVQDDRGLGKTQIAMLKHRRLAHHVDPAVFRSPRLPVEIVDEAGLPVGRYEFEVQGRLVAIAGLGEAIEQILGHIRSPAAGGKPFVYLIQPV